jgi:hypothetical protein
MKRLKKISDFELLQILAYWIGEVPRLSRQSVRKVSEMERSK